MIYQREHPGSAPDVFKNKKISKMKTLITTILLACTIVAFSQTPYKPKALTAKDYKRAEMSMSQNVGALTKNLNISPTWTDNDNFWFTRTGENGQEKVL